ncbi:MAG: hypothetical protein IJK97_10630, partial [Thermoguttaceae bacterium]|nr:hypothetical protein [Thermoguttaceae bacterium]
MRRPIPHQDLENGQDSFLDVVSNIVGILIILVVVVGAQVKSGLTSSRLKELAQEEHAQSAAAEDELTLPLPAPEEESPEEPARNSALRAPLPPFEDEREKLRSELAQAAETIGETAQIQQRLGAEVQDLQLQKARLEAEQTAFAEEIVQMTSALSMIQKELETKTSEKDLKNRELLALSHESVQLQNQIKELEAKIKFLQTPGAANGGPKTIEHKMTPIVRSVDSQEVHFMLDHGYILRVPLEELMKEYERKIPTIMHSLMQNGVRKEVLGPYDGFRLDTETRLQGSKVGVYLKVIPPDIHLSGETLEEALRPESNFHGALGKLSPGKDTITFWIYPTGFGMFNPLKNEAYRLGFAVASRPLPEGTPIAG